MAALVRQLSGPDQPREVRGRGCADAQFTGLRHPRQQPHDHAGQEPPADRCALGSRVASPACRSLKPSPTWASTPVGEERRGRWPQLRGGSANSRRPSPCAVASRRDRSSSSNARPQHLRRIPRSLIAPSIADGRVQLLVGDGELLRRARGCSKGVKPSDTPKLPASFTTRMERGSMPIRITACT